jgi:hypothetical protein
MGKGIARRKRRTRKRGNVGRGFFLPIVLVVVLRPRLRMWDEVDLPGWNNGLNGVCNRREAGLYRPPLKTAEGEGRRRGRLR